MKANELRLSSLFEYEGCVYAVSIIRSSFVRGKNINGFAQGEFPIEKTEPIPLTEEWLLKFGFKQDSNLKNSLCKYGIWFNKTNMEATYLSQKLMKINYVHQLQNLYFALTGEELTIKDNMHEKQ